MDIKEINKQIRNLQHELNRSDITDEERIAMYDTLTFYLDLRDLKIAQLGWEEKN